MSTLYCFALAREAAPFRRRCPQSRHLLLGVGRHAARRALQDVESANVDAIVVAGFAGSLVPEYPVGAVVEVGEVVDESGHCWKCDASSSVRLLTASRLVAEPSEKRAFAAHHLAQLVDMESAAVACFAADRDIPFRCVRVVSDGVDDRLAPEVLHLIGEGQVRPLRLAGTLVRQPSLIKDLVRLGRITSLAADRLAEVLVERFTQPNSIEF